MSEEIIVRNCSPTLAGIKTGNIFSCQVKSKSDLCQSLRNWNRMLVKRGLRIIPLRFKDNRALVYMYRPKQLSRDLANTEAKELLGKYGYDTEISFRCLSHLVKRIAESEEFPHEIGLFLGYPPEDVCGFINNNAECKCVGAWKVYGDEVKARRLFEKYKKCTSSYCQQLANGRPIERLALARA